MARSYEEFHEQNKGKLKEEFSTNNRAAQDVAVAEQKQQKLERENHIQKRIQDKMLQITEERAAPQPTPTYVAENNLSLDSIHREAIQRVQSEITAEKKEWTKNMVEESKNQSNAETPQVEKSSEQQRVDQNQVSNNQTPSVEETESNQAEQKPDKAFKAKVHAIVDEAQKLRTEASRTFRKNRTELIAEAEALGAEDPARDVSKAQREVHKVINQNEHKHLHALFQENGWDYEKQGVQFVEEQSNSHSHSHESEQENTQEQTIQQNHSHEEEH